MNINGKPTNPGDLRTQITLLSRSVSQDAGGFGVPLFTTIAVVWARWINVHGSEVWAAHMAQADQPATVQIRYRASLDNTLTVARGSYPAAASAPASTFTELFDVISLDDIQDHHEYIELKVVRTRNG